MVLQDSTIDSPTVDPVSDPDPYGDATGSSQLGKYFIQTLPAPNVIVGVISGISAPVITAACGSHVEHAAQVLSQSSQQRLPTQIEAEALAQHCAAGLMTASYGKPLGYTIGLYRAYATRKIYRFPFRTPDPKTFDPTRLTIFGTTLFEGQQARVMWHMLRCTAYGIGMAYLGGLILGISGAWKMTVGEANDDRLKEVVKAQREAVKTRFANELERMKKTGSVDNKDANEVLKTSREQQMQERSQRRGMERKETARSQDWDDASPSAAGWHDNSERIADDFPSPADAPGDQFSTTTNPTRREKLYTKQRAQQETDQAQYDTSADSFLSDLETPNGETTSTTPSSTRKGPSNESAWDRIRRENSSSSSSGTS